MTITAVLVGLAVLIGGIVLGAALATRGRATRAATIDEGQYQRNADFNRSLRYSGPVAQPRMSEHDKRLLRR